MIELIVESDPELTNDRYWSAVVRCVTDIKKGDHLSAATPYFVKFDEAMTIATQMKAQIFPVDLVIVHIISCGKEWDVASHGMVATVFLKATHLRLKL